MKEPVTSLSRYQEGWIGPTRTPFLASPDLLLSAKRPCRSHPFRVFLDLGTFRPNPGSKHFTSVRWAAWLRSYRLPRVLRSWIQYHPFSVLFLVTYSDLVHHHCHML